MTPAELKTLREACGLSLPQFAALAGVRERTARYWEQGHTGVPADAARLLQELDTRLTSAAQQALAVLDQAPAGSTPAVTLLRYRDVADLHRHRPDMRPLPTTTHAALLYRAMSALQERGAACRIVYFDPADFEAWRAAQGLPSNEAPRSAWAALQA